MGLLYLYYYYYYFFFKLQKCIHGSPIDPFGTAKHPLGNTDQEHNEEAERNGQTIC
jgi:hypothetical protein